MDRETAEIVLLENSDLTRMEIQQRYPDLKDLYRILIHTDDDPKVQAKIDRERKKFNFGPKLRAIQGSYGFVYIDSREEHNLGKFSN